MLLSSSITISHLNFCTVIGYIPNLQLGLDVVGLIGVIFMFTLALLVITLIICAMIRVTTVITVVSTPKPSSQPRPKL